MPNTAGQEKEAGQDSKSVVKCTEGSAGQQGSMDGEERGKGEGEGEQQQSTKLEDREIGTVAIQEHAQFQQKAKSSDQPMDMVCAPQNRLAGNDDQPRAELKRLHSEMTRFSSSTTCQGDVDALLAEVTEASNRGNTVELSRLLFKGAAWLQKPSSEPSEVSDTPMSEQAKLELRSACQTKVRKALLICLEGLDLMHAGIMERSDVQLALQHIGSLIEAVDLNKVRCAKQWLRIHEFIRIVTKTGGEQEVETLQNIPLKKPRTIDVNISSHKCISMDEYTPNPKVRALDCVVQGSEVVILKCSVCEQLLKSNWYWTSFHGDRRVLVPRNGHSRNQGKFCPINGEKLQLDHIIHLEYCTHGQRVGNFTCKLCQVSSNC